MPWASVLYLEAARRIRLPQPQPISRKRSQEQSQLLADQFKFIGLRVVEGVIRRAEIRAGISQRVAEPRLIECNGLIVVIGDGIAIPLFRMATACLIPLAHPKENSPDCFENPLTPALRTMEDMFSHVKDREQIALYIDVLVKERFAQGDLTRSYH